MDKRFTVKIQKIGEPAGDKVFSLSAPLILESEDDVNARRGSLYGAIQITGSTQFDSKLVMKIITDGIQSDYFSKTDGTPLACLEKAIIDLKDKIVSLLQDPEHLGSGAVEFNSVVAVLWGSVLYVLQYGDGCAYLVREGKIKPVNASSEGNFSVASGAIRDKDIVVLGSKTFCEQYSPDKLLTASYSSVGGDGISAVILKFSVEKSFIPTSMLDIRDSNVKLKKIGPQVSRKVVLGGVSVLIGVLLVLSVVNSLRKSDKGDNIVTAVTTSSATAITTSRNLLSQATSLVGKDNSHARELLVNARDSLTSLPDGSKNSEVKQILTAISDTLDSIEKITFVEDKPYYDLHVDDAASSPTEIVAASDNSLFVIDNTRSKFYRIGILTTSTLAAVESTRAARPRFLAPSNSGAVFMGSDSFYAYDGGSYKVSTFANGVNFPLTEVLTASSYLGNVYAARGTSIYKNSSVWVTDKALSDAVSMAIDGDILVLTKNGAVLKYSSGVKDEAFGLKNLDKALALPTQFFTTVDLEHFYILDRGNSRIVVTDKSGGFVKQFRLNLGTSSWDDLRSISVSSDEKLLFVLAGSKIYKINLDN